MNETAATETASATTIDHKLRVGVMLDDVTVASWVRKILTDIQDSEFARIRLVLLRAHGGPAPVPTRRRFIPRLITAVRTLNSRLYDWYVRDDRRRFAAEPDAFEEVDISAVLSGVPTIRAEPTATRCVDRFADDDIARIRAADLDVLLRFGFRVLKGEILRCARFGVWSYHHGDNRYYRGGPALFWEMYEKSPVAGVTLQVLNEDLYGGPIIYRSISSVHPISLYATRNPAYWKAAAFVPRRLEDLSRHGFEYLAGLDTFNEKIEYRRQTYGNPSSVQMLRVLLRTLLFRVRARLQSHHDDQWLLGFRSREAAAAGGPYRVIEPPANRFFADPFIAAKGDRHCIFFEDCDFASRKGVISAISLDKNGNPSKPEVVLEREYHLSYPFVFQWQGEHFMVPDSGDRQRVDLYRCTDFPGAWVLEKTLLEGFDARDATLLEHKDRWWMFLVRCEPGGPTSDELFLYFASSPLGPWEAHPKNPVKSDVTSARPAGRLFFRDGQLIRPAQDCSRSYGYAIALNRVDVLSETDYRETRVGTILPTWRRGLLGTHTIDSDDCYEVIDGKLRRRVQKK